jgi:hypothetical protein
MLATGIYFEEMLNLASSDMEKCTEKSRARSPGDAISYRRLRPIGLLRKPDLYSAFLPGLENLVRN